MRTRFEGLRSVWVLLAVGLLVGAQAAGGASMFTVDANGNGINEVDGSDDATFSFIGSAGLASGSIGAVDLGAESPSDLESLIDGFLAFLAGITPDDFDTMDILIFDVVVDEGSAPLCEVGVAVGTDPLTDPDAAGDLMSLMGEQSPDGFALSPGIENVFPGAVVYSFDLSGPSSGLESGEVSTRLFVLWEDGWGPQVGQTAVFMISSGTNNDFQSLVTDTVAMCVEDGQGKPCTESTDCCSGVGNCTGGKRGKRVCASPPAVCGDGFLEGSEECEAGGPLGDSCLSLGFDSGTLSCDAGSCQYDTSACVGATCKGDKQACTANDDCCSLKCDRKKGKCKGG